MVAVEEEGIGADWNHTIKTDESDVLPVEEPISIPDQLGHGGAALDGRLYLQVVCLKDGERFKCSLCHKKYSTMGSTNRHIKAKHVIDI